MIDYLSKEEAKEFGYTHSASYYGIPVYIMIVEGMDAPVVEVKYSYTSRLIIPITHIEAFCKKYLFPFSEKSFCFKIKEEL